MIRRMLSALLLAVVAASLARSGSAADRKGAKVIDAFWTSPALATLPLRSIAVLPIATYDGSFEARRNVETWLGQTFRNTGYRWIAPLMTTAYLKSTGGDSALQALNDQLLRSPRLDSLAAPAMSRLVRARAMLTVRIDQYEQHKLEYDESGRPSTSIQLHAALVDSTGQLLWTASGGENMDGPYQDASSNPIAMSSSGLNNQPVTSSGGPPDYREVLSKLLTRWADAFPHRAEAPDSSAAH